MAFMNSKQLWLLAQLHRQNHHVFNHDGEGAHGGPDHLMELTGVQDRKCRWETGSGVATDDLFAHALGDSSAPRQCGQLSLSPVRNRHACAHAHTHAHT